MRSLVTLILRIRNRCISVRDITRLELTNHISRISANSNLHRTKDKKNDFDKEAIKVEMSGLGIIGYVANSPYTVMGDSMSAGRMYDRIKKHATGTVVFVLPKGVLCELDD